MDKMRDEFEGWLGIKPCGAAHDLAWVAWKAASAKPRCACGDSFTSDALCVNCLAAEAARAKPVSAIDTSSERVEKYCENRHDCQPAGEAVAWRVWRGDAYELFFNKESAVHRGNCFVPNRRPEPLYTAPSAQVTDGWQLVEQLADALRNVEEEMRLLSWQKSIELRRPAGSFGIAVKNDQLALEWQKVDAQLQDLYSKRRAALDAAPQPKLGE